MDTKWTRPDGTPLDDPPVDKAWLGRVPRDARVHVLMLKVKKVAAKLGVSTAAVFAWVESGELAHTRLFDHAIRVSELDLAAFIRSRASS